MLCDCFPLITARINVLQVRHKTVTIQEGMLMVSPSLTEPTHLEWDKDVNQLLWNHGWLIIKSAFFKNSKLKAYCREDWWGLLQLGCWQKSHAGGQNRFGDASAILWKSRSLLNWQWASQWPPESLKILHATFCSLVLKECNKKLQCISGLMCVWYPPLKLFVLLLIFHLRGCDSNHISLPEHLSVTSNTALLEREAE